MEKIDLKVAQDMAARYQATRKTVIDKAYGINDTKSIWFDIAGFKNFVNNLPAETTGVRVYLAAYDETNAEAPGQTTVVLVATVNKGQGNIDAVVGGGPLTAGLEPVNKGKECPPICD